MLTSRKTVFFATCLPAQLPALNYVRLPEAKPASKILTRLMLRSYPGWLALCFETCSLAQLLMLNYVRLPEAKPASKTLTRLMLKNNSGQRRHFLLAMVVACVSG